MPKKVCVFPAMLLSFIERRRYSRCFLLFCYVTTAFLASLYFHSQTTMTSSSTNRRSTRSIPRHMQCNHNEFEFTDSRGTIQCKDQCPRSHHPRISTITGSTCIRCADVHCLACSASPSHCDECSGKHVIHDGRCRVRCPVHLFSHKGKCSKKCPKGYKKNRKKHMCVLKKGSCRFTQWIPSSRCHCHRGSPQRVLRREILRGNHCRGKVKKLRRCKSNRACEGSSRTQSSRKRSKNKQTNNSRRRSKVTVGRTRNNNNRLKKRRFS